jgi:hypothetical protein
MEDCLDIGVLVFNLIEPLLHPGGFNIGKDEPICGGFYSYSFGMAVMPLASFYFNLPSGWVAEQDFSVAVLMRFGKASMRAILPKYIDPIGWMLMFKI